ncbi:MAG: M48 family metalloprotease [Microcystaceae cyanobacterium]
MTPDEGLKELEKGLRALQRQNYSEAIQLLEQFCHHFPSQNSAASIQARMALVRAYRGTGETEKAIPICQNLVDHSNSEVASWAQSLLSMLQGSGTFSGEEEEIQSYQQGGRTEKIHVKVLMPRVADSLKFAMAIAVIIPILLIAALCFGLIWLGGYHQLQPLAAIALGVSLLINGAMFFLSPLLLDWMQEHFYQVEWGNLGDVQKYSPEAGEILLRLCRARRIPLPRLGFIQDRRPTAYSYGIRRHQARLIVSKGIFRYLEADEIAMIYAHELGHIEARDGGIMTFLVGWEQLFYGLYLKMIALGQEQENLTLLVSILGKPFYALFQLSQALNFSFSRTREYYADHFAVENTGNPNALIRALVKISKGIVKQERRSDRSALFLEGMRLLGIYDFQTVAISERNPNPQSIRKLLQWELLNPWSQILEFSSSHPVLGKRLQVLTYYAEQLDLGAEYELNALRRDISTLDRRVLYFHFCLELLFISLPLIGSLICLKLTQFNPQNLLCSLSFGWGLGLLLQTLILFIYCSENLLGKSTQCPDLITLLCDLKMSPLGIQKITNSGKLQQIVRPSETELKLYFQDRSAVMPIRFPLWYHYQQKLFHLFRPAAPSVEPFFENSVTMSGFFYRGLAPYLVLESLTQGDRQLNFYPHLDRVVVASVILLFSLVVFLF